MRLPALLFSADGYATRSAKLMGRQSAGDALTARISLLEAVRCRTHTVYDGRIVFEQTQALVPTFAHANAMCGSWGSGLEVTVA